MLPRRSALSLSTPSSELDSFVSFPPLSVIAVEQDSGGRDVLVVVPKALIRAACLASTRRLSSRTPSYKAHSATMASKDKVREIGPVTRHQRKIMQSPLTSHVKSIWRRHISLDRAQGPVNLHSSNTDPWACPHDPCGRGPSFRYVLVQKSSPSF
jgi:hypothetical protein